MSIQLLHLLPVIAMLCLSFFAFQPSQPVSSVPRLPGLFYPRPICPAAGVSCVVRSGFKAGVLRTKRHLSSADYAEEASHFAKCAI